MEEDEKTLERRMDRDSARASSSLIESLIKEMRDNSVAVATFIAEGKITREKVDSLSRTINDSTGKGSLTTRMSLVENEVADLRKEIEKNDKKIERLDDTNSHLLLEERKDQREQVTRSWQFWTALIAAIIGLITAVLTIFKAK